MRQGQHKNRSRNRGRRPGSTLNRVYESNGPDVKVRGTAQTVADKYLQLARDATASGDIIKAESFYQHAEHYLRIVAASQPFMQHGQQGQQRRSTFDDDVFDETDEPTGDGEAQPDEVPAMRETQPERSEPAEYQAQPQPQPQFQPQPQPQTRMQPREVNSEEGGNGWDGHQPDFLRRGAQPNGMGGRSRRGGRGRCKPAEARAPAGGDQPQAAPAEDDRDDLGGNG